MERLSDKSIEIINALHTERLDYDSEYLPLIDCAQKCSAYEDTGLEPERVAELAQAEKDGRLVVLPCKVGDTIYVIPSSENYALNLVNRQEMNNRVYKQTVSEVRFFKDDYLLTTCDGAYSVLGQFFGENWFLSIEEAKEKLLFLWDKHKHMARRRPRRQ